MSIQGKKIVLTGTFSAIERKEAQARLEAMGADVTSDVSSRTDMLFAGTRAGSKLARAEAAGVPVYHEAELMAVLETGLAPALEAAAETAPAETAPAETAPAETAPAQTAPAETAPAVLVAEPAAPRPGENASIDGKRFVVTGEIDGMERHEVEAALEALGARCTGSVSGKTDYLVAGTAPGPNKLAKAEANGIPVLDQPKFRLLLAGHSLDAILGGAARPVVAAPAVGRSRMPTLPDYPVEGEYVETNDAGVVTCRGQMAGGKRTGTWHWFHDSGARQTDRDYQDGKPHGREQTWYQSGGLETEGENLDGERQGRWVWRFETGELKGSYGYRAGKQHGDYEWWHTPEVRHSVGGFRNDERFGPWTWWREDGKKESARTYDESGCDDGVQEQYYGNGQLELKGEWSHGLRVGPWHHYYQDGKPQESATYLAGEYDGVVEKWDPDGEKTSREYARGLPTDLDPKKLASIAKRIKKKKHDCDKMEYVGEFVEYDQRAALLVYMHEQGVLNLGAEPMLWNELDGHTMSGTQLASILSRIKSYPAGEHALSPFTKYWPRDLDELSARVYARDPEPLDAAWKDFPEPVRKGFSLVLRRFGAIELSDLEGDLAADLAHTHVTEYGLPDHMIVKGEDGSAKEVPLFGADHLPNDHYWAVVDAYCDREQFHKKLLQLALKHTCNYRLLHEPFRMATPKQLEQLYDAVSMSITESYHCLDELRSDGLGDLLQMATTSEQDYLREPAAICAIRRLARSGEPVPEALDAIIELKYHTSTGAQLFDGLEQTIEALRALPEGRWRAILDRGFESQYYPANPIPLLGEFPVPALQQKAFEVIAKKASEKYYDMQFMSRALARWGKEQLPLLAKQYGAAKSKTLKDTYRRAIVYLLADLAERGEPWAEAYDEHIEFHDWSRAVDSHDFAQYLGPFVARAVTGLPRFRAERLLIDALDGRHETFTRPLECLKTARFTAVWQAAFTSLLDNPDKLQGDGAKAQVTRALAALDKDAEPWVRWCVENSPSPELMAILADTYHDLDEKMKRWAEESGSELKVPQALHKVDELAKRISEFPGGGKREPIYLLKNVDAKPDDSLNQIGGCPPGVTARSWPTWEDEPMEHLFTLDLDTMPELRGADSKTRAVAMFINQASNNEAWEPGNGMTALVSLTRDDLDHGALEEPPGRGAEIRYFVPVSAEVPSAVWDEDLDHDSPLGELRRAIYQANARVLGAPIWLQDSEHLGFFVMQFDEGFVDINLGDMGVMYVFSDTQFWQCH